jgi:hypothetical protein
VIVALPFGDLMFAKAGASAKIESFAAVLKY